MRLLFLTTSHPQFAGDPSGHFVSAEAEVLREHGAQVTVLHPRGKMFGFPGVLANLRSTPLLAASLPIAFVRFARALRRAQKGDFSDDRRSRAGWDRVVAHWSVPMGIFALTFDCPIELVSHGQDVRLLVGLPRVVREHVVRLFLQRVDRWRFVSDSLRLDLLGALEPSTRALLLSRSYIAAPTLRLPDEVPIGDGAAGIGRGTVGPYWVVIGRLVRSKRVEQAIAYATRHSMKLYVVGDGPERAQLEASSDRRFVSFLGTLSHPDALRWLRGAEALLFASSAEGESTVLREAKRFGVRVIDLRSGDCSRTPPRAKKKRAPKSPSNQDHNQQPKR